MQKQKKIVYCPSENKMVDTAAIVRAMDEKGMCRQDLADELGVSLRTIRNRLDFGNWYVGEAYRVCEILGLSFDKVFLAFPDRLERRDYLSGVGA